MHWSDDAFVLTVRPFGEGDAICTLLCRDQGRHAGLIRGLRRHASSLQPGNRVHAHWRARLADQLGHWQIELVEAVAGRFLDDAPRLASLQAAAAIAAEALAERDPQPGVFDGFAALTQALDTEFWAAAYIQWEMGVLAALGFGIDLSRCAATGRNDQLAYVSPRTGRAVSLSAGEPYRDRLLPLPPYMVGKGEADATAIVQGLALTGHFLERHAFAAAHRPLPAARQRLAAIMTAAAKDDKLGQ